MLAKAFWPLHPHIQHPPTVVIIVDGPASIWDGPNWRTFTACGSRTVVRGHLGQTNLGRTGPRFLKPDNQYRDRQIRDGGPAKRFKDSGSKSSVLSMKKVISAGQVWAKSTPELRQVFEGKACYNGLPGPVLAAGQKRPPPSVSAVGFIHNLFDATGRRRFRQWFCVCSTTGEWSICRSATRAGSAVVRAGKLFAILNRGTKARF